MNTENFIKLVADMRKYQQMYFKTRAHGILIHCKELEKKVDEGVKQLSESVEKEQNPPLFQ